MEHRKFRVVGVDLGAQPRNTAWCVIAVDENLGTITIEDPVSGERASDDELLKTFPGKARIGIDAPLGWPLEFICAISRYRDTKSWPANDHKVHPGRESKIEYRNLKYRKTDLHVWKAIDKRPLGVAAELIGSLAMRAARLLARAESEHGLAVDRSGRQGHFVEVYPAAAFKRWSIPTSRDTDGATKKKSYKKDAKVRERVLNDIRSRLGNWARVPDEYSRTDDHLDALVSGLVALMRALDDRLAAPTDSRLLEGIPSDEVNAEQEGWIALPRCSSLGDLQARVTELGGSETA